MSTEGDAPLRFFGRRREELFDKARMASCCSAAAGSPSATYSSLVFVIGGDPVLGLIATLNRPGGNVTNTAVIVPPASFTNTHSALLVALAAKYRLPTMYAFRAYIAAGGLISYGVDGNDLWTKAAGYVDRILVGAKPHDLPVQTPTKFELVINLRTAKALGLEVSSMLLTRADEVME